MKRPPIEKLLLIRLLALDVDGVLTDGAITWSASSSGETWETKSFNARDGLAHSVAACAGLSVAWVTGRASAIVTWRAGELGVSELHQGTRSKRRVVEAVRLRRGLTLEQVAFLGDDLNDLPAFDAVGLRIAVADGAPELIAAADWVTERPGGAGAVREVIETVLRAQDRWETAVRVFLARLEEEQGELRV